MVTSRILFTAKQKDELWEKCHHIRSVSEIEKTKITDLVPLCANCHRMAHRSFPKLPIAALRHHGRLLTRERSATFFAAGP
jgi:hypothetical protein